MWLYLRHCEPGFDGEATDVPIRISPLGQGDCFGAKTAPSNDIFRYFLESLFSENLSSW